eukprot:UC1_evm1s1719
MSAPAGKDPMSAVDDVTNMTAELEVEEGGDTVAAAMMEDRASYRNTLADGVGSEEEGEGYYSSEEEEDIEILPPDHPAMQRVQEALKKQLMAQRTETTEELVAQRNNLKMQEKAREDVGVRLYTAQQQLVRLRTDLEKVQETSTSATELRAREQDQLVTARGAQEKAAAARKVAADTLAQAQREYEMMREDFTRVERHAESLRSRVTVEKRAASKASRAQDEREAAKQRQDLYVDRQNERIKALTNEVRVAKSQHEAQLAELAAASAAEREASAELEEISLRRKELQRLWQGSLVGLQKRNDALAAMQTATREQQQELLAKDRELGGAKRTLQELQDQNETLTSQLSQVQTDLQASARQLEDNAAARDAVKREYSTLTKTLQQVEEEVARAQQRANICYTEVKNVRERVDKLARKRVELDDKLLHEVQDKLVVDKASKGTTKALTELRLSIARQESQLAQVENDLARQAVQEEVVAGQLEQTHKATEGVKAKADELNAALTKYGTELRKNTQQIARKQSAVDGYNRKIAALRARNMAAGAGQADITPAELEIKEAHANITHNDQLSAEKQRAWLSQQSALVATEREIEDTTQATDELRTRHRVMSQKRLRVDGEIESQRQLIDKLQRNMRNLRATLVRMNQLAGVNIEAQQALAAENSLMEGEFLQRLKEEELESIQLQERLDELNTQREQLVAEVLEAEKVLLLWEKKITLAKETKASMDPKAGGEEISTMRKEIHRMEVRLRDLEKTKEELIVAMERSVGRREKIFNKAKVANLRGVSTTDKSKRQALDLKKRIKQALKDASRCEAEAKALSEDSVGTQRAIVQIESELRAAQERQGARQAEAQERGMEYSRCLEDTVYYQHLVKHYEQAESGALKLAARDIDAYEARLAKQEATLNSLNSIVAYLAREHPELQPDLVPVTLAVNAQISRSAADTAAGKL